MNINITTLKVPATARNGRIYTGGNISNNNSTNTSAGGGDKNFVFTQGVPSATWVIQHNLGKYPSVTVIDTAGTEVEGEVQHIDINNLVLKFSAGFGGSATLN